MVYEEFDEDGRMKPSAYYDRIVDVMEELMKFTLLTRDVSSYLTDRYSERKESAAKLETSSGVSKRHVVRPGQTTADLCELAARRPCCERPDLTTITGLLRAAARAADMNLRDSLTDSM